MPLTALERARAAYLWQLQDAHTSLNEQLADVRHVFAALLGEPVCSLTSALDEARPTIWPNCSACRTRITACATWPGWLLPFCWPAGISPHRLHSPANSEMLDSHGSS